eukprot:1256002-Pleurochrysis_carterae.AAC.1
MRLCNPALWHARARRKMVTICNSRAGVHYHAVRGRARAWPTEKELRHASGAGTEDCVAVV